MKHLFIILTLLVLSFHIFSQSVVSTANSKSGILVGSSTNFAGINYESSTDKFSFNYKFTKQANTIEEGKSYPNFWGVNIGSGIKIEEGKSNLVNNDKWQGGVDFDFTISRTIDNSKSIESKSSEDGITHKTANISQKTLYIKLSNALDRFKSFDLNKINQDTTFVTLNNPLQNIFTISPGFYTMYQFRTKCFFSYAFSANISAITNSTRKLSETNLIPITGELISSKDSALILQSDKQETYFSGKPENEIFIIPRADIFFRYRIGEKKPVLGLLASYSPVFSSFESVRNRNCFAFGPTFGLDTFPDQVVFAIMNEFNQNKKGEYKYTLTFQASFPIKFK